MVDADPVAVAGLRGKVRYGKVSATSSISEIKLIATALRMTCGAN